MLITFLGTSAANAYPEAFCRCKNCEQARILGGKSIRKRSAALINDDLLIDLGPDILTASNIHNCSFSEVRYCLQTHAHADHLDTSHFLSRSPGYGVVGAPRLHFYASSGTLRHAAHLLERDCAPAGFLDPEVGEHLNLEVHQIDPQKSFTVGPYRVTAFPANHDPIVEPLLYAIQMNRRTIFYATDTASLSEEIWRGFHKHELQFDLVILDHTYGLNELGSDHLSARQFIEHVARMRNEGLLAQKARAFATHIAHEGNPAHPELVDFAKQYGYEIAYDGLVLDV
jgi:phosphoribosyl 1,2-cyclic phosphate phosphodiesterase